MPSSLKTGLAALCHWTGVEQLLGALTGARDRPLVLGYHRVVEHFDVHAPRTIRPMLISRAMLEQQLEWVGRHYRFASLDELGFRLESGSARERLAAVTFDDGYRDVYENAFPLLKRKGIPAAVFVVTDIVGSAEPPLHDRLYLLVARALSEWQSRPGGASRLFDRLRLPLPPGLPGAGDADPFVLMRLLLARLSQRAALDVVEALCEEFGLPEDELSAIRPLSWEELSEMQRAGITIGSHTRSHALLTNETEAKLGEETTGSRAALERRLGAPIHHFAYPDGRWNRSVVDAARAAGYRFAYTTCAHRDPRHPLLTIPRTLLWERSCADALGRFSPSVMSGHARGVFGLIARCKVDHGGRGLPAAA